MKSEERIQDFYEVLSREKKGREELMRDVAQYVSPTRSVNTAITDNPDQTHYNEDVFDGKAVDAARKMTDGIFGNACSPASNWVEPKPAEENSDREFEQYLRETGHKMLRLFPRTNFYTGIYQFINDGVSLGNAALLTRGKGGRAFYKALNPFHWFFSEDDYGDLKMFMYRYPMTAIEAKLSLEKVPKDVEDEVKENPTKKRWYLYTIFEQDMAAETEGIKTKSAKPYQLYVTELGGDEILYKSGFNSNPVTLWFYRKNSGEKYGRGPGDDAYQDLLYTNQLSMSLLEGQQLRAAPPMIAGHEMKAYGIKYAPKGVTYYNNPERKPEFLTPGGEYMSTIDLLERRDKIIEYHFMTDFWTMLSRSTTRQTAYEVSEKQGEKLALIAYVIQNFFSSLQGVLERTFDVGVDLNIFQRPGDFAMGKEARFVFNGFLAQAQRRAVEGQGMLQALNEVFPIIEADPNSMIVLNTEKFVRKRFEVNNVDSDILRTEKEVEKIKANMAAEAQQQQQVDQAAEIGKASKDGAFKDIMNVAGGAG